MHMIYDKAKRKWALYRRIIPEFSEHMIADDSDRERKAVDRYYRSYAYAESDDLREWKNHRFILSMDADDPADTELYQFACHKIGADLHRLHERVLSASPQPLDIHLATSRDGINFTRVCRGEPFIPSGPLGYYDYMAMACSQPEPIIVDDTVYIYYAAANCPHERRMCSATTSAISKGARRWPHSSETGSPRSKRVTKSGAVPRRHQAVHRAALQTVPERRHLAEGIDPRRGTDARLAADSRLRRTAGPHHPGRRSRPSGSLER